MKKILEDVLLTGLGTLVITKEKAEELVEKMIKQGDVTREEGRELLEKFKQRTGEEKDRLSDRFYEELENRLSSAGFVTQQELKEMKSRLDRLEHRLEELSAINEEKEQ